MILDPQSKQPSEVLDYDVTYDTNSLPLTDTISGCNVSYVCVTDPADVALVKGAVTISPRRVKMWFGAGSNGKRYKVTAVSTSAGGRTFEDEFYLTIKDL